MNISVMPSVGYYRVFVWSGNSIDEFTVSPKGMCNCGGRNKVAPCDHTDAVAEHLARGGGKAGQIKEAIKYQLSLPDQCPICEGEIVIDRPHRARECFWECAESAAHYWMWRGGDKVREFLTRPHPNKVGSFYTRSLACLLLTMLR
jgi:hypothetical protein